MSRALRISLVLAAVIAAAATFTALRPGEQPAAVPDPPRESAGAPADAAGDVDEPVSTPAPKPRLPRLTAGTVRKLSVRRGETVAFRVRHPSDEELHVHGYDISRPLPAGETVTVRFPARIEGIFEIELEHSGTHIASLQVEP